MARVVVRSLEGLAHEAAARDHRWIADEPSPTGSDRGPDPYELLLASLGACTAMTLRLYADRKGWPLEGVTVELTHARVHADDCDDCPQDREDPRIDRIEKVVRLRGDLGEEQRARLLEIAGRCPVHRTLTNAPHVVDRLE